MATTRTKPQNQYEFKLAALREAATEPTDPMHEDALRVLDRRERLMGLGYDGEVALDKALAETNRFDDTAAA